ncbi:DUF7221 family queuine tRNA-ribosyltransferase-like protein [Amycolatopsis nigrescens]|uniref:deazapurine DNA modification protein DpdA family protein n=1 Tax=Amycolatopsis nigrescens TaxID=381445 RepID=UPI000373D459|nr:hypothetical protein [Amycolatopsis nigrescens]
MPGPTFYLGAPAPGWLAKAGVPLFVSDTRLRGYKTLPVAVARWALDSGGFTQLQKYGDWTVPPAEYVARVRRYRDETGLLDWAAPQDWMCEDAIINGGWYGGQYFAGTHLTVDEHHRRTVLNVAHLRELAPDLHFIPVVQGRGPDSHRRCADLYWTLAGIDLTREPLVGVGSVCRIQNTAKAGRILTALRSWGLTRMHGFGFKLEGLNRYGHLLGDQNSADDGDGGSADSQAWSAWARWAQRPLFPECVGVHKNCANCLRWALHWRQDALAAAATPARGEQLEFWEGEAA